MMLKVIMEKLVQDTYMTQNFLLHILREVKTVLLFFHEVPSASQIMKDTYALYGALLNSCQGGVECMILMEIRNKQDGIRVWYPLVNQYLIKWMKDNVDDLKELVSWEKIFVIMTTLGNFNWSKMHRLLELMTRFWTVNE
jgi:hypothetical protein